MGVTAAALPSSATAAAVLSLLIAITATLIPISAQDDAAQTLLTFKAALANSTALHNWDPATNPPCTNNYGNWVGVLCWQGHVWGLQLENMNLVGQINLDPLAGLPYLRTLSFINNQLEGPLPGVKKLKGLKSLYLSDNHFSGEMPDDAFDGMSYLKKLHLANNKFTGKIPSSMAKLPRLIELKLEWNQLEGNIPDFHGDLKNSDFSNNGFNGSIPPSLSKITPEAFTNNEDLCGTPLDACNPPEKESEPVKKTMEDEEEEKMEKMTVGPRILIIVLTVLLVIAMIFIIITLSHRALQESKLDRANSIIIEHQMPKNPPQRRSEQRKLTFITSGREKFDLPDLLRASAEVLGSGSFSASYRASLQCGEDVVVKRFKAMNSVGREEFHEHMRRLARLHHPNLLPLVAYYFRREEKLLVFDFVHNGSLASHLHGNRSIEEPGLDWPTRLNIIRGVVEGLAYLHSELPGLVLPHGHLKSSNVLLNDSFEPQLTDYSLVPLINPDGAEQLMVAYKSPEFLRNGRPLRKTDVWSLGILILEVMSGKFPASYLARGSSGEADMANWVEDIAVEAERSMQVFDKDMDATQGAERQMMKLLKLGFECCEEDVEKRLGLREVVSRVEEVRVKD